jgi:hypothetical protein
MSDQLLRVELTMQSNADYRADYLAKKKQVHEKCAASVALPEGQPKPNWLLGFRGWPGLEAARAYTRLAEELAQVLLPPEAQDLTVMARGSMARREMVWGSDADLIVLRPQSFPPARYREITDAYVHSLKGAGLASVSLAKWSTFNDWRDHQNAILTDVDQADRSRFVCGSRELYDCFRTELASEEISAALLYQRFLVRCFWRLLVIRQKGLFPEEPDLKFMPGGVRWGLWYAAQAAAYETVAHYREMRRAGCEGGCVEILSDPSVTEAASFLLWLRDWNQVYARSPEGAISDQFSCDAQRSLAETIGVTPHELLSKLRYYQNIVLAAVDAAERRVHEAFANSVRRSPAWLDAWQPVLSELLASAREQRPVNQDLLSTLSLQTDDPVFNLALAWFSNDVPTLQRCASHLPSRNKLSPGDWPLVAGLRRNGVVPEEFVRLCSRRI